MSSVPNPPGTQITSSCGQSAKVMVGVIVSTESLVTGSIRFQIRCTLRAGHAGEHLQRAGEVELGHPWKQHDTDLKRRGHDGGVPFGDFGLTGDQHPAMVASCPKCHISLISGHRPTIMIGVLIFPDFQLLDAAGPISAFEIGARFAGQPPSIKVLAVTPGPVRSSSGVEMLARGLQAVSRDHDPDRGRRRGGAAGGDLREDARLRARDWPSAASASPASAPAPTSWPKPACSTAAAPPRTGSAPGIFSRPIRG